MRRARSVFGLHLALAGAGVLVTLLAVLAALSAVTMDAPSPLSLLRACRSFVLPQVTPASVLALILGSVAFAVVALAVRSARRQVQASGRFIAGLEIVGSAAAGDAIVFDDGRPLAFCAGFLRPRVYVSSATVAALEDDELEAVLAHEAHHARYRDPLRICFARVLSDSLFFLPALRSLADRYADLAELAADAAAVTRSRGDTRPLASALLAFDARASSAVVGIAPERVDQLLGERPRWQLPLALLAWSGVVIIVLVVVTLRTAQAADGAMVSLPLLASQLCMLMMAVVPLALGAGTLLAGSRAARALRL